MYIGRERHGGVDAECARTIEGAWLCREDILEYRGLREFQTVSFQLVLV